MAILNKNIISFLSEDKSKDFENEFSPRKLEYLGNGVDLDDFLKVESKIKENKILIDVYKKFHNNTSLEFDGIWINSYQGCQGDGISWLAEKLLRHFQKVVKNSGFNTEFCILKEDKEFSTNKKSRIVNNLIQEKVFIKCAQKSGLLRKSKRSLIITLSCIAGIFIAIPSLAKLLNQQIPVSVAVSLAIITLIGILIDKVISNLNKEKDEEKINDLYANLNEQKIEADERYKNFTDILAEQMYPTTCPRILIIDDFSKLDSVSQDVLLKYYNNKINGPFHRSRDFWVILNTGNEWYNWYLNNKNDYFSKTATLQWLEPKEKKELVKTLNCPSENTHCDVIKDICYRGITKQSRQETENLLKSLQDTNIEVFNFLCFIASNFVPADSIFSQKGLMNAIRNESETKQQDKYIPYILTDKENLSNNREIIEFFEQTKQFIVDFGGNSNKFKIRYEVLKYIKDKPTKKIADIYHYSNGYWALYWDYIYSKRRLGVNYISKLAQHLTKAYPLPKDNDLNTNLFDAHLRIIKVSISYYRKEEIINLIESVFDLNILGIANEDKLQKLAKYCVFAFLNFDYLPGKNNLRAIGYEQVYDFLKKDDIELAKQLLNTDKYKFLSDEIIFILIDRYWEKMLFLNVSDKRYTMRNAIAEIQDLKIIIEDYIAKNKSIDTDNTEQKIRNIALWVWVNTFDISNNEFETENYAKLIDTLENLISQFITYSEQNINCRSNIEQTLLYSTMLGNAHIIISSILTIKSVNKTIKYPKLQESLQKIIKLYQLKINITDNNKAFSDVLKLIQLQSLIWRASNCMNRYFLLTIIRIQLYSCWNTDNSQERKSKRHIVTYTVEDEQKYKFKNELEFIKTKHHLNTIANFTLCNLYNGYGEEISSNYFQQACKFTENTEITKSQLEYMFMCLVANWRNDSPILTKVLDCFVGCEKQYTEDILFYIANDVETSYAHLINTLQKYKNAKVISFFARILEQLKQNDTPQIEGAEALWTNFEFEQKNKDEKFKNKQQYETFWADEKRKNLFPYSDALIKLLLLEQSDKLKNEIYTFLVQEDLDYDDFSGHLELACYYLLCFSQDKDSGNYKRILEIVKELAETTKFKNCLSTMQFVYNTLTECTNEPRYQDALSEIKLKLTYNRLDNQIDVSAFDFLCHLCNVWLNDCYYNIDCYNELTEQEDKKKQFLKKYKHAPIVISKERINAEFLLINEMVKSLRYQEEYKTLIDDCNKKANENLDRVIEMILDKNPKYTEQIQRLREQWEEQIVYEGEENES
jgi:hypothetical protein